jgi:hypothetical protein
MIYFLLSLSVILLIVTILAIYHKPKIYNSYYHDTEKEYIILDTKLNIKEVSSKFCKYLDLEESHIIENLKSHYGDFFNLLNTAIHNNKSFIFILSDKPFMLIVNINNINSIKISICFNYEKIFNDLPIPISIDFGFDSITNSCYTNFGKLQSTEFLLKGQFFSKHNNIFRREVISIDDINIYSFLFPVMKIDEYSDIQANMHQLPPIAICVMNRNGEIIAKSDEFDRFFQMSHNLDTFQDFLESVRGHILHDSIFFADFKKHFLILLNQLNDIHEEIYSTVDGKVILFKFIAKDSKIYFVLSDITKLSINKTQEYLFKDIKTKIIPQLSDSLIITDADGIVETSNCELVQLGEHSTNVRSLLQLFTNSDHNIQEIGLSNNGKCFFVKMSIKDKVFKARNYVSTYLDKIIKILYLLNNTIDGSLSEYLKYIKFITINIDNKIKTLELGVNRVYECQHFDIISEFHMLKESLEEALTFKNLHLSLPKESIFVFNNKECICLLLENILLTAFKYQFNHKNLIIEEKNEKIAITLDGINKDELELAHSMFEMLSNINITANIKEVGDRLSIGFDFDKVNNFIKKNELNNNNKQTKFG